MSFGIQTYNELMTLVQDSETFWFKDFELDDKKYRIFNYGLCSWTSFQTPSAKECRGTMFDVTDPEHVRLVSAPPAKFFNYEEGAVDHTVAKLGDKMVKMDGSLISTYIHNGELYLKSKGSLFSTQALDSMKFLAQPQNAQFKADLTRLAQEGYTINLEYTSPENRIVVAYQTEGLTVLSVRSNLTGENLFASKLKALLESRGGFEAILSHLVAYTDMTQVKISHADFVEQARQELEGEGYVQEFVVNDEYSYLAKVKNLKYIALHHTKDSVSSSRRLFEAIINEASDDLRSLFAEDEYFLAKIQQMEDHIQPIYNHIVKEVNDFYEENKDLDKREYSIKAVKNAQLGGLFITHYISEKTKAGVIPAKIDKEGRPYIIEVDYKKFAIKNRRDIYKVVEVELPRDAEGNIIKIQSSDFKP